MTYIKQPITLTDLHSGFIQYSEKSGDKNGILLRLVINQSEESEVDFSVNTRSVLIRNKNDILAIYNALRDAIKASGIEAEL